MAFGCSLMAAHLALQPRLREPPVAPHRRRRHLQHRRGLFDAQPAEEAQIDDAALPLVELRQRFERIVEGNEIERRLVGHGEAFVEGDAHGVTAALLVATGAGVIHEDASHDAGRDGEKMRAVVPRDRLAVYEAEIGLVDERGGLEAVARPLAGHAAPRDVSELLVDERNQLRKGSFVALPPGEEQASDMCRMIRNTAIVGGFPRQTLNVSTSRTLKSVVVGSILPHSYFFIS